MLIVIRDGWEEISKKASFVVQIFRSNLNTEIFYVFRKEKDKFREKWDHNQIKLATSTKGILLYYFLMMLKSPKDLHQGLMRRIFHRKKEHVLINDGFISMLSQSLYQYFARSAREKNLIQFLRKLNSPKIFLIDEYLSINSVNLEELKDLGFIVYVSQDLAYDRFGIKDNFVAKNLMYKFERSAIALADVVVACSERDRLKYIEMGARKAVYYPNIYPLKEFEPCEKDRVPSISIVLRKQWGPEASRFLEETLRALSFLDKKIRVNLIGIEPRQIPRNIELKYYNFISNKLDYLRTLSKSWIGINIGIHDGGTNQKKYDYALSGTVVLSDKLGARGDLLPYEYTYVDYHDLAAKLKRLLEFNIEKIKQMGTENRKEALLIARKQQDLLVKMFKSM